MNVLVINCGSSSLKYQLIDMNNENVLAKGLAERIGIEGARVKHEALGMDKVVIEKPMTDHKDALKIVLDALVDTKHGAIKDLKEINAVGHRVVHGGEKFSGSVVIDDDVIKALEECIELAPLHNPPNLIGIRACQELMPGVPMVGVFDTAFHQTMPKSSYIYPLPYELYEKYGIRKYGFHGTSHRFVSARAAEILGKDLKDLKIVTCHLGNGASLAAVKNGESVDTSMGFTPLEGLAMGTRCGDIDPAIVTFIMEKEGLDIDGINNLLNKKSGVLGISGVSSDFRDIEIAASEGNERAQLALDKFNARVKKYIAAYAAVMGGVDAVVFTAGLGENSASNREAICSGLEFMGIEIDKEKNNVRGKDAIVSTDNSKVKVLVVPTNEELMIAKDTVELL
ncbi:acetate/propionate family kinase [Paramaledivibacter caminithermalis]|jgi:acetate kinase|uniref:Acetate kinase n=1 Tax=Paramaledivibacter caminithermalis (strain DSM 15212 / CIP 107654 / DViRD3) TaxID=1121301 RepID=A0A1M6NIT6_PARC5|nr:acetate kinase [Paramaledivibacter caminithermalis]SHJ95546.1 acetate kinase [Paramaledivibacter caminithermalis DSM 15212]